MTQMEGSQKQLKGLIIDTPHVENIMHGRKTWEMRSSRTHLRGTIALIRKGSGTVVGVAELVDSIGPMTHEELLKNQDLHLVAPDRWSLPRYAKYKHAWVMKNARALTVPISYAHPSGAQQWVNLDDHTARIVCCVRRA